MFHLLSKSLGNLERKKERKKKAALESGAFDFLNAFKMV